MLNLSITGMNAQHVEESCADLIEQQRTGASTHAMLMMYFNPEGTPAVNKAESQCALYDRYREILDRAGAKHGVLVQSTLGHITKPFAPYPFQPSVSLVTGEDRVVTCCPLDPHFHDYIREQFRILAEHKPSLVMLDDDLGLLYKPTKGCACKYHLAEFARRAGKKMTREEIYACTQGSTEEDKRMTQIYVDTQREGIVSAVRAMREGLDTVDPSIPGIVSGIYTTTFVEFSDATAVAFAGKGNPTAIRLNGGPYAVSSSPRGFLQQLFRAAILKENVKDKVEVFLAETDTCPHNRYSTSAAYMHGHFVGSILEGATGAKHWITRGGGAFEPNAGKAYRKILSKYAKFYEALCEYVKDFSPFGCRIPLTLMQNYGFVPASQGRNLSPWATCVLERLGLPVYFGNAGEGAVFLDDFSADGFDDGQIRSFMRGTLILSVGAAEKLLARGFGEDIGVTVRPWEGKVINGEIVGDQRIAKQYEFKELVPCREDVEILSESYHTNAATKENVPMFPAVTRCKNSEGGEVIVFCGTPDMPFLYHTAFSLLCETRKNQLIEILSGRDLLPIYYPEDGEVYLRAGRLGSGERMVAAFNLGFDVLEDMPLTVTEPVKRVERLLPDGTRESVPFTKEGNTIRIQCEMRTLMPQIFFLS